MKKIFKVLPVFCVAATALSAGLIAACSDNGNTENPDDGFVNDYTYESQFEYTNSKLKADDGINIDGVLDEEFYGRKNWITARCVDADVVNFNGLDQTAKYTVHFSETGFVFAAEVHGNWPIRSINYDTGNTTCIESYFGFDGIDALCEIDMTADGRFRISEFKSPTTIMTFDLETKPLYRTTLFDKNEDGEYMGYNCEAFVPYSTFGIDKAPEIVYSDVTLINWNVDAKGQGTEKVWYPIAINQCSIWQDGYKRGYKYDKDGFISYGLNIAEAAGGRVEERFGYDYIVPDNVTQLKILPDSGMQIAGVTVNGEDRTDDIYADSNGNLLLDVRGTGDLKVVPEFCRLSENYIVTTIATDGAQYSGFAEEVGKTGVLTGKVTGATVYGVSVNGVFAPVGADGSVSVDVAALGFSENVALLKVKALTSDELKDCNISLTATDFDGQPIDLSGKTVTLTANAVSYAITVGASGKLNIARLPAGEYTLSCYGLADKKITVSGDAQTVSLTQSSVYSSSGNVEVVNKTDDTVVTVTGGGEPDYISNSYSGSASIVTVSSEYMTMTANIKIKQQNDWKASRIAFYFTDNAKDGLMVFTMQNNGGEFNVFRTNTFEPNDERGGKVMLQPAEVANALYGAVISQNGLNLRFVRIGATLGLNAYINGEWKYLGSAQLGTGGATSVKIFACGNIWEISQIRSEELTYHEEVKATASSPNGNFAYVQSEDGAIYNAYGKPSTIQEIKYVYGDPQIISGEVDYENVNGKYTITEHGVPSQYKYCSVEARLYLEDEIANSKDVTVIFTAKSTAAGEWYARRFGISMTDGYDGFMFFLARDSESNVFTMADANLDDDKRPEVSRLLTKDDYRTQFNALNSDGLKFKVVRSGDTITLYAEFNGSFVELTQTQLRSSDAKTRISFLATGDTWVFSDITVE